MHCTITSNRVNWTLHFQQGFISIYCPTSGLYFRIRYPEEDHWVYTYKESTWLNGATQRGANIKNTKFSLDIDVREYMSADDPKFDPNHDETGEPQGFMDLDVGGHAISVMIPYTVAIAIMNFVSGSTDTEGIMYIKKYYD